jgi:hypothetical protein
MQLPLIGIVDWALGMLFVLGGTVCVLMTYENSTKKAGDIKPCPEQLGYCCTLTRVIAYSVSASCIPYLLVQGHQVFSCNRGVNAKL